MSPPSSSIKTMSPSATVALVADFPAVWRCEGSTLLSTRGLFADTKQSNKWVFLMKMSTVTGLRLANGLVVMTCCSEWQDPWDHRAAGSHEWVIYRQRSSTMVVSKIIWFLNSLIIKFWHFQIKIRNRNIVFFCKVFCLLICDRAWKLLATHFFALSLSFKYFFVD